MVETHTIHEDELFALEMQEYAEGKEVFAFIDRSDNGIMLEVTFADKDILIYLFDCEVRTMGVRGKPLSIPARSIHATAELDRLITWGD